MSASIVYGIAGFLLANGMPHLIHGAGGRAFRTPFGHYSSAMTNFVWGWLSFVVGAGLVLWRMSDGDPTKGQIQALLIGNLVAYILFSVAAKWFLDDRQTKK